MDVKNAISCREIEVLVQRAMIYMGGLHFSHLYVSGLQPQGSSAQPPTLAPSFHLEVSLKSPASRWRLSPSEAASLQNPLVNLHPPGVSSTMTNVSITSFVGLKKTTPPQKKQIGKQWT